MKYRDIISLHVISMEYLSFVNEWDMVELSMQLFNLIRVIHTPDVLGSLVKWIHHANHMEGIFISEEETLEIILRKKTSVHEVWDVYALDSSLYSCDNSTRRITTSKLINWHKRIFRNRKSFEPGQINASFINNGTLNQFIKSMNTIQHELDITFKTYHHKKLLFHFAYAAYVMYYLLGLKLFKKGNDLVVRFASKHILGAVCPMAFPIDYEKEDIQCPGTLLKMMLHSAINYYASFKEQRPMCIPFESDNNIKKILQYYYDIDQKDLDNYNKLITTMDIGDEMTLTMNDIEYIVRKDALCTDISMYYEK